MELPKNEGFSIEGSHRRRSGSRAPKTYRVLENLTEGLIYLMVVFSPWLFGTVDPWAVWIMNGLGYGLGILLVGKWLYRWRTGYEPPRWESREEKEGEWRGRMAKGLTRTLGWLTVLILTYVLVSGLNARATFYVHEQRFEYFECIGWLPHSYDRGATMFVFWMYLGLAFFFWATRDWLLGKTARESAGKGGMILPDRLRRLLWVICINGGLLAVEALLQRLSGTDKVLWIMKPRWNNTSEVQYGPYPYRSNAAEYFNLIWPLCLGFWCVLQGEKKQNSRSRIGAGPDLLLVPAIVLMAASPIISTSRGGAAVALIEIFLGSIILLRAARKSRRNQVVTVVIISLIVSIGGFFGWGSLAPRLKRLADDQMGGRLEIYQNASRMNEDFGLIGSGPGSFGALYQLYRSKGDDDWAGYLHDDWLETKITFGGLGSALLSVAIILPLLRPFLVQRSPSAFIALLYISLGGLLLHAKFDFPVQIYSILLIGTLCCVIAQSAIQDEVFESREIQVK